MRWRSRIRDRKDAKIGIWIFAGVGEACHAGEVTTAASLAEARQTTIADLSFAPPSLLRISHFVKLKTLCG